MSENGNTEPKNKSSFVTPEQFEDAQKKQPIPTTQPVQEHPYVILTRMLDTIANIEKTVALLVEQQNKKLDAYNERVDKFFGLLEGMAKPKPITSTAPISSTNPAVERRIPMTEIKQFEPSGTTPVPTSVATPAPVTVTEIVKTKVDRLTAQLGNLSDMLEFDVTSSANMILIKPKQYLGSENFSKIGAVLRANGGMYVSAGKASHFEVSKADK